MPHVVQDENGYMPRRLALRLNPPTLVLEYSVESKGEKKFLHRMPLAAKLGATDNVSPSTRSVQVAKQLQAEHAPYLASTKIPFEQLTGLVDRVLEAKSESVSKAPEPRRDAEAEAKARQKDARDDLKLSALRAESELTGDAPRIVNRKLQKKSQSADDLLGMALMEEACKAQRKRDKAAAAAAAAAQKSASPRGSRDVVFPDGDDMRDVPRNTNRDVGVDEARTLDDAVALLDSMSKSSASKSESNLAGLAKGMRRTGSSATLGARRGVRKVSSKSALFAMEANMEAIAIG